jgi:aspartate/methionine/tyrosine aminotransferase
MDTEKRRARQERLASAAQQSWLAERMKRLNHDSDVIEGFAGATAAARYLSDLGEELGDVISLSGGTIGDMLPPDFVRDAARDAVEAYPHYPGIKGHRDVRVAMARKLERENGINADPDDEILPTIGCQQVIDSAFRILVNPGDEVLIMDPEYASTAPAIRMAGGKVVPVPLQWDGTSWHFDLDELERRAGPQTKLLVMSNPSNPSGIVFSREELQQIAALAMRHDFWVFSDEEYEKTLFDGATHTSIASLPGMKERTVTGYSFSKPFGMTAYRIGYMVGPAAVMDYLYDILRFSIQACSAVGLRAAHAVLTGDMAPWLAASTVNLQSKRDYIVERLNEIPGIRCNSPRGVYFVFPDIRSFGISSFRFAEHVLRVGRVSIAPGIQFGPQGEGHVRVSFCPSLAQITEGLDRLEIAVAALSTTARVE